MNWILFAIAGSVAQLIDGALGMGFGLTSSTLLLTLGASAAVASAAVHAAEIGTTLVSGASHWHAENIDKDVLIRLAIPGGVGALLGATFLSSIDLSIKDIYLYPLTLSWFPAALSEPISKPSTSSSRPQQQPTFLNISWILWWVC